MRYLEFLTRYESNDPEVIAQQIFAVSRLTPVMMLACFVTSLSTIFVFHFSGELTVPVVIWSVLMLVMVGFFTFGWQKNRNRPFPKRMSVRTRNKLVVLSFVQGLCWAVPGLLFLPYTAGLNQAFLMAVAAGMIAGGAITLYPVPAAAFAFSGTVAASYLIGYGLAGETAFIGFAAVTIFFFLVVIQSIKRHKQMFEAEFLGRRELITKNRLIEELLEKTRSEAQEIHREAEEKLAQAQRIEAIGRLTAGVAHDFNNLLAVIIGNIELADEYVDDDQARELLEQALRASGQGAELTQKLLAFGRRARLDPKRADIEAVVAELCDLVRRTLPANIEIGVAARDNLPQIEVDRAQLESALLNLALNARDAMPCGGKITFGIREIALVSDDPDAIKRELAPGRYLRISVADTGTGIKQQDIEHVFEPFFTTKSVGKGSGLGLSMVYGFAKQSGGHAEIQSNPGVGTEVVLLFPITIQDVEATKESPTPAVKNFSSQRVLLIEDSQDVRDVLRKQLTTLGLDVVEAETADEGLSVLRAQSGVDLLLTDVVMPGYLQGQDLARIALQEAPTTGVVMMSGYPKGAASAMPDLSDKVQWLSKPIRKADLADALRRAQVD